jgi:digeranylgeranylglycerophospholipid reductase
MMNVVIVGAGPAGLITSLFLVETGIRPLILEMNPSIVSTPCGEGCTVAALNRIPFDSTRYISKLVRGSRLIQSDGSCSYTENETAILDRADWLRGMAETLETSGGQIAFGKKVTSVHDGHVLLQSGEKIEYEVLIGADGPRSPVAGYLGVKSEKVVVSQYEVVCDTREMDWLELYVDRGLSSGYSWIFPKHHSLNVGMQGDFARLDEFIGSKGLAGNRILNKTAGIIPVSGIQKLAAGNIALIGDSTSMPNPLSGGGLAPIIYAARILADNIHNLPNYESAIRKHPIAAPVLLEARRILLGLTDADLLNLMKVLTRPAKGLGRRFVLFRLIRILKHPLLLLRNNFNLLKMYRAAGISRDYGW